MFYKLIEKKRDQWFNSNDCTVKELVDYIVRSDKMRDAQIEAIKTYLFLKIACENRPLWELFYEGVFNSLSVDDLELKASTRVALENSIAAMALLEYAMLKDSNGVQLAPDLENIIKRDTSQIDYKQVFKDLFYGVSYSDYLFSLPMGAGKTYLMAAFIYIDLFFAQNEPDNRAFAHNFVIVAPSGLKSSVVPSLKTIQRFDPSWIISEPAASNLKRLVKFEVLDGVKSKSKSNKAKNPNVQKINMYQPFDEVMGLVAVTNAEKVILDRLKIDDGQIDLYFGESNDERDKQANELRNIIGKLPNLAIYIDEVHHAMDDDIKLRAVVNKWMELGTINSVVGFSGTPYLDKADVVRVVGNFALKSKELTNVVYYYPLIKGINNFLKEPIVNVSTNSNSLKIVESGVKDFLNNYKDRVYVGGLVAKLAVYCGNIENLEEFIYPRVSQIVSSYGLNPDDVILKYHKGNKEYNVLQEAETEYASLDLSISKKRIVLLVQIGKEGWDCRSLTGVVLSQKGDCPTNMVLQTSCRCLRQVDKNSHETAIIWLNKSNADTLNAQLKQQQNITLEEFSKKRDNINSVEIKRYPRIEYLQLPPIDFYQLKVHYETLIIEERVNIDTRLDSVVNAECELGNIISTQNFRGEIIKTQLEKAGRGDLIAFNWWLYLIAKESFGFVKLEDLNKYRDTLLDIFNDITCCEADGNRAFNLQYNQELIRGNVRKAFYEKRSLDTREEIIPEQANLLKIESLRSPIKVDNVKQYYPEPDVVDRIIKCDGDVLKNDDNEKRRIAMEYFEEIGNQVMIEKMSIDNEDIPERKHTYHYLPYRFDSGFEQNFFRELLTLQEFTDKELEVYFNGDKSLTEFQIRCYKKHNDRWGYIGRYTPDFLIINRKEGAIFQAIIVETKGDVYANSDEFKDRRSFVEESFIKENNNKFGYKRFDYLYLEDSLTDVQRVEKMTVAINSFFE